MHLFLIYDRKAETLQSFFTAAGHVEAIRGTVGAAKQNGSVIAEYPEDFELRYIGAIDRKTCNIALNEVPEIVGSVANLLSASEKE